MRKQASGECRAAFYAAKSVGNGFKRKVEPETELQWGDKVIEVEIAYRTIVIIMTCYNLLSIFFKGIMAFAKVLMAKSVKRLEGHCEEHNSHQGQVEYGKPSFHYRKDTEKGM